MSVDAITVAAAAERLNVCTETIYREVKRGNFTPVRIGRALRIPVREIEARLGVPPEVGPARAPEPHRVAGERAALAVPAERPDPPSQ